MGRLNSNWDEVPGGAGAGFVCNWVGSRRGESPLLLSQWVNSFLGA